MRRHAGMAAQHRMHSETLGGAATVMDQPLSTRVKAAIVRGLHLPLLPENIADDVPLFGEGLGLDSVDALELVLELEREFGIKVTDDQLGRRVLRTVNTIVELIEQSQRQPLPAKD